MSTTFSSTPTVKHLRLKIEDYKNFKIGSKLTIKFLDRNNLESRGIIIGAQSTDFVLAILDAPFDLKNNEKMEITAL